jgi:hypothetical protein
VGLIAGDEPPYVVPDFGVDNAIRAEYDAVAKSLVGAAIAAAIQQMKDEHEFTRLRLEATARAAEAVLSALDNHAHLTRSKYARIVPKRRTASGIVRPPTLFFDNLLSMGAAEKFYKQAVQAAQAKREALVKVRTTRAELAKHMGKIESALVVRELDLRRHFKSDEGKRELEADPRLADLAEKVRAMDAERKDYLARLSAGTVSDEERRDRSMAEEGYRYVDGEVLGLHCLHERELRFGDLRYLMFRDRLDRIWVMDYAGDLMPLTQMRFDIFYQNGRYLVSRAPASASRSEEEPRRAVHEGTDPRAYMGMDPELRKALRQFAEREKGGN